MHQRHRRHGHPGHQGGSGLPLIGIAVDFGLRGDFERARVPAATVADHQAIRTSCETLATTSKEAIDKVNEFVGAFNAGRSTGPTEGPAIEALNNSASSVSSALNEALSPDMRDAFNAYTDAVRSVANAIGTHAPTGEFNRRVDQLNDTKTKALKLCMASY